MTSACARAFSVAALGLLLAGRANAAVTLLSALPTLGVRVDVRSTSASVLEEGHLTVDAGYAFRAADQLYDREGRTVGLSFNQEVVSQTTPITISYGASDRLSLGFTINAFTQLERRASVVSFSPGSTLIGIPLPVGETFFFEQSGRGPGDLTLNSQYDLKLKRPGRTALVQLDATLPTAEEDQRDLLDIPVGQGNASFTLSTYALQEFERFVVSARLGYETNARGTMQQFDGRVSRFRPGDGFNYVVGPLWKAHRRVRPRLLLFGVNRGARVADGVAVPDSEFFVRELRPGLELDRKDVSATLEAFLPLAGKNILRSRGVFATGRMHF